MKLSDAVGAAGLSAYAEVALLLFLVAFVLVVVEVVSRRRESDWEEARALPLGADEIAPAPHASKPEDC